MSEWPQYISHRLVRATPIVRIEKQDDQLPRLFVDPSRGREPMVAFAPTEPGMSRRCQIGDYAMLYPDGFRSVCPKMAFEQGYSAHTPQAEV